jgi:hypothetical protein
MRKMVRTNFGSMWSFGFVSAVLVALLAVLGTTPSLAQNRGGTYSTQELVQTGHKFFGTVSGGLATVIEEAVSRYGQPNGYILGEEGSGAFVGGLRYGEGRLNTRDRGTHKVYWQGPSLGWDFGGEGSRTMMLVYNLPSTNAIFQRFGGVDGSAYFIGGFGMTALVADRIYVVPVRAGVGLRLGVNIGYLKFTPSATWNPF